MVKKLWNDAVWSKVIATGIVAAFVWIGAHFDWWPATAPSWLLGILGLIIVACLIRVVLLESRVRRLSAEEHHKFWKWVGMVSDYADYSELLNAKLEAIWHLWNNEGEKLIYPLFSGAIPDVGKPLSWNERQLLEFRILYRTYIDTVKTAYPEFHSQLIDEGFPCDFPNQDYLSVRHKIATHGNALHEDVSGQIKEWNRKYNVRARLKSVADTLT